MSGDAWTGIGLVLLFILIGGVFAGTELALVSLRESQLARLEKRGRAGAKVAEVARNPNRFLAAVQIGVTVAGFFSAAYGASALAPMLAPTLESWGLSASAAAGTATVSLTLVIAYLSLVLGELVPKRLALQRAEGIAVAVTPALDVFATLMRPVIWLLSVSTNGVVRLLGGDPAVRGEEISRAELQDLVIAHEEVEEDERRILVDVMEASERTIAEVMRPRGDVEFVESDTDVASLSARVAQLPYSRYPVIGDGVDDVRGFLHVRDLLGAAADAAAGDLAREILHVPGTARAMPVLSQMRASGDQIAVVVDEYGGTDGIVTFEDLLEELVGAIQDEYDDIVPESAADAEDGWDASLTIEEFGEASGVHVPDGPYETVAGYVLARLGRTAEAGDAVEVDEGDSAGAVIEVTVVDGLRVRRVDVRRAVAQETATDTLGA